MPLHLNPLMRDNAEFFNSAKSFARREEALKRLINCADVLSDEPVGSGGGVLDYIIWQTPTGRYVPVWLMNEKQTTFARAAADFGVVSFRR